MKKILPLMALSAVMILASCGGSGSSDSSSSGIDSSYDGSESSSSSSSESSSSDSSSSDSSSELPPLEMTGSGTREDPYILYTRAHLEEVRPLITANETTTPIYVQLGADIDLSSEQWAPIGDLENPANVVFNGGGHTISGLLIEETPDDVEDAPLGLFGAVTGEIYDLTLDGEIDVISLSDSTYAGLLAGYASNLYITDVHTSGSVRLRATGQYQSLYSGGIVGFYGAVSSYYVDITSSSSSADVTASAQYIGYAGGIAGALSTSFSSPGISAVNSCVYEDGIIEGSTAAGGIIASTLYYASVVNSVVTAERITVTDDNLGIASAGGIVGDTYYENAFLYNIVETESITAADGISSPNIGTVAGYVYESGHADGSDIGGASIYGNLGPTDSYDDASLTAIGFALAFDLHGNEVPTLKETPTLGGEGTATLHANDGSERSEDFAIEYSIFNQGVITNNFTSESGLFVDISYDQNSYVQYKWFAPLNADIDLYDVWYDPSPIVGWHLGPSYYNPALYIEEDGTITMMQYDGCSEVGTYWSDGQYLVFHGLGDYDGVVATIEDDNSLVFADTNDSSYIYDYSKAPSYYGYYRNDEGDYILFLDDDGTGYVNDGMSKLPVTYRLDGEDLYITVSYYNEALVTFDGDTISFTLDDYDYQYEYTLTAFNGVPTFSGSYLGRFSGDEWDIELLANGNVNLYRPNETGLYSTGGYRAYGNTIELNVWSLTGNYDYDPTSGLLIKEDGSEAFSQNGDFVASYHTADQSVYVYRFADGDYLIVNGNIVRNPTISGDFSEGSTVIIEGNEYVIEGEILVVQEEVDYAPVVGTYDMYINETDNGIDLVLNLDGTGTYDGAAITYEFDGENLTFDYNYLTFTLTFDSEAHTLTGIFDDGDYQTNCTFILQEEEVTTPSLLGSWSGNFMSNTWTFTINNDGTLVLTLPAGDFNGTWEGDLESEISFTSEAFGGLEGTITLEGENDASMIADDYDYNSYNVDLTRN